MAFREVLQINGVPVRIHADFDREVKDESGRTISEMEVAIMLRGRMPNKQFIQLITKDTARLDFQDGARMVTMFTRIVNHTSVASGDGEGTVYRHDITFRELPDSWQRRKAERAAEAPAAVEAPVARKVSSPPAEAIEDISQVTIGTSVAQWGDAIRQLQTDVPRPRVTEEPMSQMELMAVESVLTNLRIDALLDQLDAAGVIRRSAVDDRFRVLVTQRFVAEAIPLVGEKVARRAAREFAE